MLAAEPPPKVRQQARPAARVGPAQRPDRRTGGDPGALGNAPRRSRPRRSRLRRDPPGKPSAGTSYFLLVLILSALEPFAVYYTHTHASDCASCATTSVHPMTSPSWSENAWLVTMMNPLRVRSAGAFLDGERRGSGSGGWCSQCARPRA